MSCALPNKLPADTVALARLLDHVFPHRCPKRGEDAEAVQRYAGKRELVDLLLSRLADPENERKEDMIMNWIEGDA